MVCQLFYFLLILLQSSCPPLGTPPPPKQTSSWSLWWPHIPKSALLCPSEKHLTQMILENSCLIFDLKSVLGWLSNMISNPETWGDQTHVSNCLLDISTLIRNLIVFKTKLLTFLPISTLVFPIAGAAPAFLWLTTPNLFWLLSLLSLYPTLSGNPAVPCRYTQNLTPPLNTPQSPSPLPQILLLPPNSSSSFPLNPSPHSLLNRETRLIL